MVYSMKKKIDESKEWKNLKDHYSEIRNISLDELFLKDPKRADSLSIYDDGIYFDYSKNLLNGDTIDLLIELALRSELKSEIEKMFSGENVNVTEKRPALHVASRNFSKNFFSGKTEESVKDASKAFEKMRSISDRILSGEWRGGSGKRVKNIVNIGIGGSYLGPIMSRTALKKFSNEDLNIYYISNIDFGYMHSVLANKNPEETLFLIVSKSFATTETIMNFKEAQKWIENKIDPSVSLKNHFIAVTANRKRAVEFGIDMENILELGEWIGGRYSVSSPANLSLMLSIGPERFEEFLKGFHSMDIHFRNKSFIDNIPVLLALIGIWYNNFFRLRSYSVIPYGEELRLFTPYLQQLDMESNGKSVDKDGNRISYKTAPVLWGDRGTNSQHSFFQLLHQGTDIVPVDFIGYAKNGRSQNIDHSWLISNMIAQSKALAFGIDEDSLKREGRDEKLIPHLICSGNRPSNIILLDELSPYLLGRLIALYEHKTFVQGVIWNIDSFDQWGVELGKKLSENIFSQIVSDKPITNADDSSRNTLVEHFIKLNSEK